VTARSPLAVTLVGAGAAALALVLSLCVGVVPVPASEVARVLLDALGGGHGDGSMAHTLVMEMRLPRAVAALAVGAGLGTAGCLLQALLRDPLASPSIIGTAQAAGFGRVLGVYLGLHYAGSLGLAFVTAVAGTALVLAVARARTGFPRQAVLLTGVNVGLLFAALIGLVQYMSKDEGQLSRMVLWLLGGLWQVTWASLALVAPVTAACIVVALLLRWHLDVLALGEESALRLGLGTRGFGTGILVLACLLTSLAVALAGVVAFVGLVVPHAARRIVGPAHAVLLPACTFLGGVLVLLVDCVARTAVPPNELPLGVLTSLIGVPCFLAILRGVVRRGGAA
jgi:iron complex transport system permease protein